MTSENLLKIDKNFNENCERESLAFFETVFFKELEKEYLKFCENLKKKTKNLEKKISKMFFFLNELSNGYKKKSEKLECLKKNFESEISEIKEKNSLVNDQNAEHIKQCYILIAEQENQLKIRKNPIICPSVTIEIQESLPEDLEKLQKNYENLLLINTELKSSILYLEGELSKQRKIEENMQKLSEKCEFFEKVNKELSSKKNEDSDDSLDLDCTNIKDVIEIQELRAALRSLSERYEQEKENILKDCSESRQDIETQMFRLSNEKAYIEVKYKDSEKIINELNREKAKMESCILTLKTEIEKLKDQKINEPVPISKPSIIKFPSDDNMISGSGDFELTESIDKFGALNSNDLYELLMEELNDLALEIKQNSIIHKNNQSSKDIIHKAVEMLIKLKYLISNEVSSVNLRKDLNETLADILKKYKIKITELERTIIEKDKTIEEIRGFERNEIQTEPSPRMNSLNEGVENSYLIKKQLQLEKSKLADKKHEIHLHKEQIFYLKKNIRDLETELDRASKLDLYHLKEII